MRTALDRNTQGLAGLEGRSRCLVKKVPGAKQASTTVPIMPLHTPIACESNCVSITRCPKYRSSMGAAPKCSSPLVICTCNTSTAVSGSYVWPRTVPAVIVAMQRTGWQLATSRK